MDIKPHNFTYFSKISRVYADFESAALDAEALKEIVVKALRFALFIVGIFPVLGEPCAADTNFI